MRSRSPHTNRRRFDSRRPLSPRPAPGARAPRPPDVILITRPEAISSGFRAALAARGRRLFVQPLLRTVPLPAVLPDLSRFQGVIASSPAAIGILASRTPARGVRLFVVGRAAARAAAEAGFTAVTAAETAQALAATVRDALSLDDGPLLYVAGVHRARDLRRLLAAFDLETVEVYAAEMVRQLSPDVRRALQAGAVRSIAFYSARAVDAFVAAAARGGVLPEARQTAALCLSPRIAARLQAHGWRRTWTAPRPAASAIEARLAGAAPQAALPEPVTEPAMAAAAAPMPSPLPIFPPPPASSAAQESPMSSPAPPPSPESARPAPGWPAVIGVAAVALILAVLVWYLGNSRVTELQAEVNALRDRVAGLNLDPGKAERAALAAKAEEAAKVATALAGVAEKAAEQATVDRLADRVDSLSRRTDEAVASLSARTDAAQAQVQAVEKQAAAQAESGALTLAVLKDQVAALETRLAKVEGWAGDVPPAQLAGQLLALSELRRVIDNGAPFAAALSRAKQAVPAAAQASGEWLARADGGVPTYASLAASLGRIERQLPLPASNASDNAAVNSVLGVLLSGIQVEGSGALVDDPLRNATRVAGAALAAGNPQAAEEAVAAVAGKAPALDAWRADLAARMAADAAISGWEKQVLASVGGSSK